MDEPMTIAGRIASIQARMASACARAGRDPGGVRLLAVSKTQPPESVAEAATAGLTVFGENKVQEAAAKIPQCPSHLHWHLVGHLQGNKVRAAVRLFETIHSVDSTGLLERVNALAGDEGVRPSILLEVNVSGEASKFGLRPDNVAPVLDAARGLSQISVVGLMTMPPFTEDPERARAHFRALRELRDRLRSDTGFDLPELSMGMSADFEVAIEEGATWIRVGTDLFGPRPPRPKPEYEEST